MVSILAAEIRWFFLLLKVLLPFRRERVIDEIMSVHFSMEYSSNTRGNFENGTWMRTKVKLITQEESTRDQTGTNVDEMQQALFILIRTTTQTKPAFCALEDRRHTISPRIF